MIKLDFRVRVRQWIKTFFQCVFLPFVYNLYKGRELNSNLIIFADAHNQSIPFSMIKLHNELENENYEIIDIFYNTATISFPKLLFMMIKFMKHYANARYVVICDYFLPVSSCNKRKETTVIQLWHSCGLLKKIAYDCEMDIPKSYKQNVFHNYDYFTISGKACAKVIAKATRLPLCIFVPTGISRTDFYYDRSFIERCRKEFYKHYPQAKGKQIILWAPTFRDTASNPSIVGEEPVMELGKKLGKDYFVITKLHPHLEGKYGLSNCTIATERLLCVIHLLITDYSSILFDYLIFQKPLVLFAPDLKEYSDNRGFYIDYNCLPGKIVMDGDELFDAVIEVMSNYDIEKIVQFRSQYMEACDGLATQRILKMIKNL